MTEHFSIRQMIDLTGLSEFTLRGWEGRYHAFRPRRTKTGRRLYTRKEVERALLLRELVQQGLKIGFLAPLSNQKLKELFDSNANESVYVTSTDESSARFGKKCLKLVLLQNWPQLQILFSNIKGNDPMALIEKFILPTIRELSQMVDVGQVSISQEHIVSSLIKELLYRILSKIEPPAAKPRGSKRQFVLATPEGDFHEIGLLLGHILIRHYGHTSLYLGANTPAKAIAETALRFEGTDILIVATTSKKDGANDDTLNYLSQIRKIVGKPMRIFLAGAQAHFLPQAEFNNFCRIQDFRNFKTELKKKEH